MHSSLFKDLIDMSAGIVFQLEATPPTPDKRSWAAGAADLVASIASQVASLSAQGSSLLELVRLE
ncbi:hypothetical protein ASC78_17290 [Variovorax sp. Root318D1]|nr:hypothetical protein ASC78_17290 [Variovorax sp. Root318D1]